MRERVSTIIGKVPVILVAPHGADDTNTAVIAEHAAKQLNCYAVINRGFERSDVVDVDKDKADCNRIDHARKDVVFDEFLRPIIKFKERCLQKSLSKKLQTGTWSGKYPMSDPVHIFHIHGCNNSVHNEANEPVEVIIGYGLGIKKDSLTCDEWRKNCFVDIYRNYANDGDVFIAKGGSRFAGRDSNNLNQYFRKHEMDANVHSMQLEFPFSARNSESRAVLTAMLLSTVILDYLSFEQYEKEPKPKFI
jgi:hypothetical protein